MKPQIALSPGQMHELKSLGLDCSDASMAWINLGGTYNNMLVLATQVNEIMQWYNGATYQTPAYTLEDIIFKTNADILYRPTDKGIMEWRCQVQGSEYDDFNYFNGIGNTPLDAAFVMLKYAIKEHPDKIKRL